jgi:hypothetical protein
VGRYGGVGLELVFTVLILGAAGHWLDQRYFGHKDYGMLIGGLLGAIVGIRNLLRVAQRMQRDIERAEAKDPEGSRWTVDETWLHRPDDSREPMEPPRNPDERSR